MKSLKQDLMNNLPIYKIAKYVRISQYLFKEEILEKNSFLCQEYNLAMIVDQWRVRPEGQETKSAMLLFQYNNTRAN